MKKNCLAVLIGRPVGNVKAKNMRNMNQFFVQFKNIISVLGKVLTFDRLRSKELT